MKNARNGWTTEGWLFCRLTVVALMLFSAGCAVMPRPLKKLAVPLSKVSDDESLRKQVEADSFPSAARAGL